MAKKGNRGKWYWQLTTGLLWLLAHSFAYSQLPDPSFIHYTTDHGLSNDIVTAVLKDRRGFMWFGTINGLNRFDGLHFTVYKRTGRPDGLPGNYIINEGLTEDKDGFIWVSTNRGLCRYDPRTDRFQTLILPQQRDQLADNDFVSPVRFDQAGQGWFSSINQIYRFQLALNQEVPPKDIVDKLTPFPLPHSSPNAYAQVVPGRNGQLWVYHTGALYRLDLTSRQYTYFLGRDHQHSTFTLRVEDVKKNESGLLYVATNERGMLHYNPQTDRFDDVAGSPTGIISLIEDRLPNGTPLFWLGGYNQLALYAPSTKQSKVFTHIVNDPLSFPGGIVGSGMADRETGIVWLCTDNGVVKIDPVAIKFSRKVLSDPMMNKTGELRIIRQDNRNDSRYWLFSHRALYQWNRTTDSIRQITTPSDMVNLDFLDLAQDQQGRLWLGAIRGLAIYDPATQQWQLRHDLEVMNKVQSVTVRAVNQGTDGHIWVGTNRYGLYEFNPDTDQFRRWQLPKLDSGSVDISHIQTDKRGLVWLQTNQGVVYLNPTTGHAKRIRLRGMGAAVQPSDRLQSTFLVDSKGWLWVSGIDFLVRANTSGQIHQTFTLDNGLRADHLFSLAEDQRGHLWLATDEQLHELDPPTGQFRYFNKANGLFSNTQLNPVTVDRQGWFFTGFAGAFNYWHSQQMRQNLVPPPVVLTNVRVNGDERPISQLLQIQPGETNLTVDFIALNYSQSDKNRYAYKLDGFDTDWIQTDAHSATYTNLEPGNYTLRIRAANNDGIWNETGTQLAIQVIPPYWQTVWFKLLVLAVIGAVLYAIYHYRESQRRRLEAIRDRIATDLHDDMGSTLSSIRIFSDVVQQQIAPVQPEAVPILQRISNSATSLSESMQDIIWTIQTKNDTLADLVTRMREFGLKLAEARQIEFRMEVADEFQATRLNVEQRRNIYLIFKESINNAIKYAQCNHIDVQLNMQNKQLRMLVRDNGQGFDLATTRQGNGLPNLQKRAREIRGTLTITTASGAGTEIELLTKL